MHIQASKAAVVFLAARGGVVSRGSGRGIQGEVELKVDTVVFLRCQSFLFYLYLCFHILTFRSSVKTLYIFNKL